MFECLFDQNFEGVRPTYFGELLGRLGDRLVMIFKDILYKYLGKMLSLAISQRIDMLYGRVWELHDGFRAHVRVLDWLEIGVELKFYNDDVLRRQCLDFDCIRSALRWFEVAAQMIKMLADRLTDSETGASYQAKLD